MFVISPHDTIPPFDHGDDFKPEQLRTYTLDGEAGTLGTWHVYEYDLVWKELPRDLDRAVTQSLLSALKHGAIIAWFAFEGSFDFDHLLHPDVASQVYAVAAGEVVQLALDDDYRLGDDWRNLLAELRTRILT